MTDSHDTAHTKSAKRRWLLLGVIAFVAVAVLAAASSSSSACGSCHSMKPYAESLEESAHASLDCYDCHLAGGAAGWPAAKIDEFVRMYPAQIGTDGIDGPARAIAKGTCLGCHATILDDVVEAGGFRIDHASCTVTSPSCDACHSPVAHGDAIRWIRVPVMEDCVLCHQKSDASTDCDTCHAGKGDQERLTRGSWQVTHGATWRQTHGMGSIAYCSTCHPKGYCVDCHGLDLPHPVDFGRTHGSQALAEDATCARCHDAETVCEPCHGMDMPHPEGFLAEHGEVAVDDADERCAVCHQSADCLECHERHTHPGRTDGTIGTPPNGAIAVPDVGEVSE